VVAGLEPGTQKPLVALWQTTGTVELPSSLVGWQALLAWQGGGASDKCLLAECQRDDI